MSQSKTRWGILAAGRIAGAFARGVNNSDTCQLAAVGSRSQDKADAFAKEHNIPRAHGSYESLLADDTVDAVYIATPHPHHAKWCIHAAEAGKHILCEKPMAMNQWEAQVAIETAKRCDVLLMEAFMYRCHPQTARLVELVKAGVVGEVRMISATFGFQGGFDPEGRLFKNDNGGGAILDVGCYPVSAARLIAGAALGKDFADPIKVEGAAHLGETGVDEWAVASLQFEGGIVANLRTAIRIGLGKEIVVHGEDGDIVVANPWIVSRDGGTSVIEVRPLKGDVQQHEVTTDKWLYQIEAETAAAAIPARRATSPAMSPEDTLGNMRTLDAWRKSIKLVYDMETPAQRIEPIRGGKVAKQPHAKMRYGNIPGIDKDISRLVFGTMGPKDICEAGAFFDTFFEAGGNCFDAAYIYGGGLSETLLGQWQAARGVRDQIVTIGKGGHSPDCFPDKITEQLLISLERQQSDYVDLYFMHRDNLDIPVGEFVDVLNEHVDAGRIRQFGGSNWTMARLDEANAYAKANGKQGMIALSNNFSLAEMVNPVWAGCLSCHTDDWMQWLSANQMPVFAWSSQARGFFVPGRAAPDKTDDPQMVDAWYSDANFERQKRAIELAEKKDCEPINIALAWIIHQTFPVYPLIGPRTLAELTSSLRVLDVDLSDDEVAWLDLKS